ncbi:aldo/keto reductase [Demequina salsinemoris]|uniref:aldo/keto reductase n=1 Tax=Demequina salsinemoris TaxID=577470 RepID=UPI0007844351|nr:aldo/keto reductase [Demequina salsinemoris]
MSAISPTLALRDGREIPQVGLGVWKASQEQATMAVREALNAGYRHIDTAAIYKNEEGVGAGLRESGVPREDVFLTTKVWNRDQGFESTKDAARASLDRLGVDYVDLLLIHWPVPMVDRYVDTWKAMIELRDAGLARSIGVSNFTPATLDRLVDETGEAPVINQIEVHPYLQQETMRAVDAGHGALTEAWSPLGQSHVLGDPVIEAIAAKHGRTPAQVVIRWHVQLGNVVIPKSVTPARIVSNIQVFDFALDSDDLAAIGALDRGERFGPDPDTFGPPRP